MMMNNLAAAINNLVNGAAESNAMLSEALPVVQAAVFFVANINNHPAAKHQAELRLIRAVQKYTDREAVQS